MLLGILSTIVPVITFGWRLLSLGVVLGAVIDLSLRSAQTRTLSPIKRIVLSIGASALLIAMVWNPLRKQYSDEHLPPSFVYVVPGIWSPAPTPQMFMMIRHYGPESVYNVELIFDDLDRRKVLAQQSTVTPEEIAQEELKGNFAKRALLQF